MAKAKTYPVLLTKKQKQQVAVLIAREIGMIELRHAMFDPDPKEDRDCDKGYGGIPYKDLESIWHLVVE
jgi:hypothetical protein